MIWIYLGIFPAAISFCVAIALVMPLALALLCFDIPSEASSRAIYAFHLISDIATLSMSLLKLFQLFQLPLPLLLAIGDGNGDLPCYQCAMAKLTAINLIRFCFHLALPCLDCKCIFLAVSLPFFPFVFYFFYNFFYHVFTAQQSENSGHEVIIYEIDKWFIHRGWKSD